MQEEVQSPADLGPGEFAGSGHLVCSEQQLVF